MLYIRLQYSIILIFTRQNVRFRVIYRSIHVNLYKYKSTINIMKNIVASRIIIIVGGIIIVILRCALCSDSRQRKNWFSRIPVTPPPSLRSRVSRWPLPPPPQHHHRRGIAPESLSAKAFRGAFGFRYGSDLHHSTDPSRETRNHGGIGRRHDVLPIYIMLLYYTYVQRTKIYIYNIHASAAECANGKK